MSLIVWRLGLSSHFPENNFVIEMHLFDDKTHTRPVFLLHILVPHMHSEGFTFVMSVCVHAGPVKHMHDVPIPSHEASLPVARYFTAMNGPLLGQVKHPEILGSVVRLTIINCAAPVNRCQLAITPAALQSSWSFIGKYPRSSHEPTCNSATNLRFFEQVFALEIQNRPLLASHVMPLLPHTQGPVLATNPVDSEHATTGLL
jgi:hypothetical protein